MTGYRRRFEWRLPRWAFERFNEAVIRLDDLDPNSDEYAAIKDEIRSLPNFPQQAYDEQDLIYITVTSVQH